tara:strand:+ start:267 stop:1181 length:915 start_codon:yes stop_codon:yes gene_type:complete
MNSLFIGLLLLFSISCGNDFTVIPKDIIEVKVTDTAPQTEVVIDYFVQPSKPESLDVLVVLDTSCSMRDDYEKVAIGMDILRGDIEPLTYDYQMAIINSSLNGIYYVGIYDSDTASIDFLLGPSLLTSDATEQGFRSHYQFATTTPEGLVFLRPETPKLYIYISDEDEQSAIPANIFKEWLDEYHVDTQYDVITISMREDSDPSCSPGPNNIGYKYDMLSQFFNKRSIDFCGDWQLALADSSFLLSEVTYIQLSRHPVTETVVVYQDGVKEEMWYYLPSTNTVYFEFDIQESAIIKIGYESIIE